MLLAAQTHDKSNTATNKQAKKDVIRVCFWLTPNQTQTKKNRSLPPHPSSKKGTSSPPNESSFPTNQTYRPCFLRKRLQALQLGGPAALVGALVASLAAGINGELAAVAARLKTIWDPSQ